MLFKFLQDPCVVKLFNIFENHNIEARFVGGVVRDELLYTVKNELDYDIAVAHDIHNLQKILENEGIHCITTNIMYKTIIAIVDDTKFEITELREDKGCDGRGCDAVSTSDFARDAMRRDFTINALYLDIRGQIYDYCGALDNADIKNRLVRFIGDPRQRICEDYLRILRYYRFSAIYNDISCMYHDVIVATKCGLKQLSSERVMAEVSKILLAQYGLATLKQMYVDGIFVEILCGIKGDILDAMAQEDWVRLSVVAKMFLLFSPQDIENLNPSKKMKKYMFLLELSINDDLNYLYNKYGSDLVIDITILKKYLVKRQDFYRITPQSCGIKPDGFSKKLHECERWFFAGGCKATIEECIRFISEL